MDKIGHAHHNNHHGDVYKQQRVAALQVPDKTWRHFQVMISALILSASVFAFQMTSKFCNFCSN